MEGKALPFMHVTDIVSALRCYSWICLTSALGNALTVWHMPIISEEHAG
jgi:hypothetical protein